MGNGITTSYIGTESYGGIRDNRSGALIFPPSHSQTKLDNQLKETKALQEDYQNKIAELDSKINELDNSIAEVNKLKELLKDK